MKNYGASVKAKLLALSKEKDVEPIGIYIRFATDRLLYRLSQSEHSSDFILKGSLLFAVWNEDMHRPTKDADLLGFGINDDNQILNAFKNICSKVLPEDGLRFEINTLRMEPIREDEEYGGKRIKVTVDLDGAKIPVQIDIGFGDILTPEAIEVNLPPLIDLPQTKLRAYPKESVVSEKTEALTKLGIANSRMKDFYDLNWLADHFEFDGELLSKAIYATFKRRKTELPKSLPLGLSEEFYSDKEKQLQWKAFVNKLSRPSTESFELVGERLVDFLAPPLLESNFKRHWNPKSGWS